jgi:predicted metal-binding membrane protein
MNQKRTVKIIAVASLIVLASTLLSAWAYTNYFMFHQNLQVPTQAGMSITDIQGTPIPSGFDLGPNGLALWHWTGTQFTLQLKITNTGTTILTTGLNTTLVPANWTVGITGNGILTQGATQTVTITALPPQPIVNGTTSGDFDLWITG